MLYAFVIMMPFALLSGLTTPLPNMPQILQDFTFVNPLRYAIDIAHRVYLEGAGLGDLVPDLWPMGIIATVTLASAARLFRGGLE
jgi:ABC-2 type transport system permease protein